jgi:4-diphosphocytidyl-2-C-methyl-D-erythritol kinase
LPKSWLLLVNPRAATPTPAVFKARRGDFSAAGRWPHPPRDFADFTAHLVQCRNDLTEAAISVTPQIRDVLSAIEMLPDCALARLSGSGATCFGLFADERRARSAEQQLRARHPQWWSLAAAMAL